ncbi:hypothetical protein [Pleomorphomonas koreensis]|uniref:hypothetical protein n=1 Tax=Pleomorphomonas koreensis TaxID=257440 RepID=UPI00047E24B7|nr:hypothetical protein [Pleomorphomonas koreensis]
MHDYTPRLKDTAVLELEGLFDAERRLLEIMELVVSEWATDPMSVACFDLRIVEEAKQLVAKRHRLDWFRL